MTDTFYAAQHTIDPDTKDCEWAAKIMYEHYYFGQAKSLLDGKNPQDIRDYVAGKQDVSKFRKMFRKAAAKAQDKEDGGGSTPMKDLAGIDWQPLALLAQPFNSALAVLQKMPIYVKCTAIDALASEKKGLDYTYLRNRPHFDASIANLAQMMGTKIDSPPAPNNSSGADISSFDLNPMVEDELNFYINMFYKLRPESAFEELLQALAYIYELRKIRDLEDRDQLYYGVSSNRSYLSDITGLPSAKYVYPGDVFTPDSDLPDYSDQKFRYIAGAGTSTEIMDMLGGELDDETVEKMFDADWALCGKKGKWSELGEGRERSSYRINYCYFEFKSPDAIDIHHKKRNSGNYIHEPVNFGFQLAYSSNHPDPWLRGKKKEASKDEYVQRKWAENTYTGYFFPCYCDKVFNFKTLPCAYRAPGRESIAPFSINIWKSQEKGAAELCIPLVDQAQKAVYKMQHAIIMARPKGMFFDAKYMRQAVTNLVQTDLRLGMKDLFSMLVNENVFMGDSEGIDPMEIQAGARPYYEIPGGITNEVEGYLTVINDSIEKIQRVTGANDALTGQTPSPDALVGVQRLMLQSSINSFYYAQNAQKYQTEKVMKCWSSQIQYILKRRSSASAKTLESILSAYKIDIIESMKDIPLHQWGIMVENAPDEQQQQELNMLLIESLRADKISTVDYVTLKRVFNYKDAAQLLAIREKKKREKDAMAQQANIQAALQQKQIEEQGKLAQTNMKVQGDIQKEITKADVQKWLAQFGSQAEAALLQLQGQLKINQQRERMQGQLQKVDKQVAGSNQKPMYAA